MKIRDSGHSTKNRDCPAKFGTVGQSEVIVYDRSIVNYTHQTKSGHLSTALNYENGSTYMLVLKYN